MPSTLADRLHPLIAELAKFVVVGGACFILDLVLFNAFRFGVGLGPLTSKALSTVIATAASYVGNRLWSFAARVDGDGPGHRRDISIYAAINVVGLAITLVPVGLSHYVLDQGGRVALNLSAILGTAFATVFRFWGYRRWVFTSNPDLAERAALV